MQRNLELPLDTAIAPASLFYSTESLDVYVQFYCLE